MSKITVVLVFAVVVLVTVVTGSAHATTLTVTEGTLLLFPMDRVAGFSGEGFAVQMSSPFGVNTASAFGVPFVSLSTQLNAAAVVIVGSSACIAVAVSPDCGSITLTHTGLPGVPLPPQDWISQHPGENFVATAPFTATGHLNFPDGGFDFVGQGIVTGVPFCFVQGSDQCGFGTPNLQYRFSVAEPPTLLLLISSFGALGALFGAPVLRDRRHRNGPPEHP